MAKSAGNFFTLADLQERGFSGREIRYLLLTAHYRETFNFTLENLAGARSALARLDECIGKLRDLAGPRQADPDAAWCAAFTAAMDEDLNVARAWAVVFDQVRELNRQMAEGTLTPATAAAALTAWETIDRVWGVGIAPDRLAPPAEVLTLLEQRQSARRNRDFTLADRFRAELESCGWLIEDTPTGPRLKRRIGT